MFYFNHKNKQTKLDEHIPEFIKSYFPENRLKPINWIGGKRKMENATFEVKGQIDLPKLDLKKHEGKIVIEKVTQKKGKFGYFYLVESECLEKFEGKDGKEIEIKASKILGISEDADGNLGWGKDGVVDNFLKKYKVSKPEDLIGVQALAVCKTENNKDFLRIE